MNVTPLSILCKYNALIKRNNYANVYKARVSSKLIKAS